MNFINKSECVFDAKELEEAIKKFDPNPKETYTIWKHTNLGYAGIRVNGKNWNLHRLICEAFKGPSEQVHHIDHNPRNTLLSNLLPCTFEEHRAIHRADGTGIKSNSTTERPDYMKAYWETPAGKAYYERKKIKMREQYAAKKASAEAAKLRLMGE